MSDRKKLRILCIHGYHQNKDIFRQKTGSFRKPLKKIVDFEFLDSPHILKDPGFSQGQSPDPAYSETITADDIIGDARCWWFKCPTQDNSNGLQESLDLFEKFLKENGPFDGIMGFSQGAAFLTLACILLQEKLLASVQFVILVAGFKSLLPAHQQYYLSEVKICIPSLHVIGDTDGVIGSDRSREILDIFVNSQLVTHSGGHYVPATKELRDVYKRFIESFLSK